MPNEYISQHRATGCNDLVHLSASHNTKLVCEKAYGNVCSYPYFKPSRHFKSKHEQYMYLHCPTLRNAMFF